MHTFTEVLEKRPLIGARVLYMLHAGDATQIRNERLAAGSATAHGNGPVEGAVYPGVIVETFGSNSSANLQVFLDGTDAYWPTSRSRYLGDEAPEFKPDNWYWTGGRWHFTVRDEEGDQKAYVAALEAKIIREDLGLSWEPDARGYWILADQG